MSLVAEWRDPIRASGGKPPLVIFFHGRGANEHDLLTCASELPHELACAAPRGPLALDFGGYTWFENRGLGRPLGESLRTSVDLVQTWIDELDTARFDPTRIFLFGFSAGMLIASALLLDRPKRFKGAVLLSGTLPWDNGTIEPVSGCFKNVPLFYARGDYDEVIPMDLVERSVAFLENESGATLATRRYPIDHQISPDELADINGWLTPLSSSTR
jgi:phospholipase/carboxylesterase